MSKIFVFNIFRAFVIIPICFAIFVHIYTVYVFSMLNGELDLFYHWSIKSSGVHGTMFSNRPNLNARATAVKAGMTICYDKFHMVPICWGDQAFVRMLEM